jgi:hypothetical protein
MAITVTINRKPVNVYLYWFFIFFFANPEFYYFRIPAHLILVQRPNQANTKIANCYYVPSSSMQSTLS